jgi:hypothetical protein
MEKKFRKTFEKMEGISFVTPVTCLSRPNTGKEDDDDDDDDDDDCANNKLRSGSYPNANPSLTAFILQFKNKVFVVL